MSDVGKRLREERDKKNLTQVQVFTKTGINNKTLSGYENGVSRPDYENLKKLSELYGVTTDYLLGEEKDADIEETEEEKQIREAKQRMIKTIETHNITSPEEAKILEKYHSNFFKNK
jgi:transcriptional regulator with XRE-family HTH domain